MLDAAALSLDLEAHLEAERPQSQSMAVRGSS